MISVAAGARPAGYRPLGLLLAVTLVTCALGWLFKGHCITDGSWDDFEQYTTGCYTDAAPFWFGHDLAAGAIPYFQTPIEYPVLTGALIYLDAVLTACDLRSARRCAALRAGGDAGQHGVRAADHIAIVAHRRRRQAAVDVGRGAGADPLRRT